MAKPKTVHVCATCGHESPQWAGRCPGCGTWGSFQERAAAPTSAGRSAVSPVDRLTPDEGVERRIETGFDGIDRVLGGGLVPASVVLLAGEPGIGKSTLLLQVLGRLASAGLPCLLVSGEESRAQVAARAARLQIDAGAVHFASGRDLAAVLATARSVQPVLLGVDSIQTLRDVDATSTPGGPSQVRACADALVGLAKAEGIAVIATGHVTKDGDVAGPRTLEHAVDVILPFEGDPRSGMRVLSSGKNRFGAEGESAWFEMGPRGLAEIDPAGLLRSGDQLPGAATALVRAGRRALAVEVQALVGTGEGPSRRQTSGLDARRFQLVAAVLDRALGFSFGRTELFGASAGGARIDDPAADLATAAALASAATGVAPPADAAFVGELSLTGAVRPTSGFGQRVSAARAAGLSTIFAAPSARAPSGVTVVPVRHVVQALGWAGRRASGAARRSA